MNGEQEEVMVISDDEIIMISDSDSESNSDAVMYDPEYDREVNIILDESELMDVDPMDVKPIVEGDDEEEEEEPLHDDGYDSGHGIRESYHTRTYDVRGIASLDPEARVCIVMSYVSPGGLVRICPFCFMRNRERFASITSIMRHVTMRYRDVPHLHCIDCQERVFVLFLANTCPICHGCKYISKYIKKYKKYIKIV